MLLSPRDAVNAAAVKFVNRVLSDYPMAGTQLAAHVGKIIAFNVGPVEVRMRITGEGITEMVGEGGSAEPAVTFIVPLALLPRLMSKDETAYSEVTFSGDSELASLLSTLARSLEWDVEEDLSKIFGDVVAHRLVDTAKRGHAWRLDATERLTENVAEYLTEERRAFITRNDLESLARANETLRDDVARLEARMAKLAAR